MLEVLEVLVLLLILLLILFRRLLLRTGTLLGGLSMNTPIDVVGLDFEVFFVVVAGSATSGRASEHAVFSSGGGLIGSYVLSIKWIDSGCVILKSMFVVLMVYILLAIIKLTLSWSRALLSCATLNEMVIMADSGWCVSTSIRSGNACVARKIEQLLAEWRNICTLLESSSFTFLNTLVKNAKHVAWF